MKLGVIILARANFGRWPDKVLFKLDGKTVLEHVIRKCKDLHVDEIIVSTTIAGEDNIIRDIAMKAGVSLSFGEPNDRCSRHCKAIDDFNIDYYLPLSPNAPFFDVEYQNIVIDCIKNNPGHLVYSIAPMETNSFLVSVCSSAMPKEMMSRPDRDEEFQGDTWVDEFYLMDETVPGFRNRYLFNANIAYKIEAYTQQLICEHLGHFPVDYEELTKALLEVDPL